MRVDRSIQRGFGVVADFVANHVFALPQSDRIKFVAVCEFGNMSEALGRRVFGPNTSPTLDVQVMGPRTDGKWKSWRADKIFVSRRLCREFQASPRDIGRREHLEAAILHELMHWCWRDAGGDPPGVADIGDVLERTIYGRVVTRRNR
jgi:hypothetical protein